MRTSMLSNGLMVIMTKLDAIVILIRSGIHNDNLAAWCRHRTKKEAKAIAHGLINDVVQEKVYYAKLAMAQWAWCVCVCVQRDSQQSANIRNGKRGYRATAHVAKWSPQPRMVDT